jgi:hypothetical protein
MNKWTNKDKSVLQCKSTREKNDIIASAMKYDEKITTKMFYNVSQQ